MKKILRNWLIVIIVLVVVGLIGLTVYIARMGENERKTDSKQSWEAPTGLEELTLEEVEELLKDIERAEEEERKVSRRVTQIRYVKNWGYNVKTAEALIALAGAGELTEGEAPEIVEIDDDGQNFDKLNNLIKQEDFVATESLDCLAVDQVEVVFNNGATLGLQLDSSNSECIAYYTDAAVNQGRVVVVAPAVVEEVKKLVGR